MGLLFFYARKKLFKSFTLSHKLKFKYLQKFHIIFFQLLFIFHKIILTNFLNCFNIQHVCFSFIGPRFYVVALIWLYFTNPTFDRFQLQPGVYNKFDVVETSHPNHQSQFHYYYLMEMAYSQKHMLLCTDCCCHMCYPQDFQVVTAGCATPRQSNPSLFAVFSVDLTVAAPHCLYTYILFEA